jgi:uncharacterized protein
MPILPPALQPPATARLRPGALLDGFGGLLLEETRTLILADLHWGFSRSLAKRGALLPDYGDRETALRLDLLLEFHRPRHLVWLGDTLHTAAERSAAEAWLALQPEGFVSILAGNHDRRWRAITHGTLRIGDWLLHHGDAPARVPEGCVEVIGHHHPAAQLADGAGARLKVPACVDAPRRLILPAFSPWAGGVAWESRLEPGETLWAVTPLKVFPLPPPETRNAGPQDAHRFRARGRCRSAGSSPDARPRADAPSARRRSPP